MDTAVRDTVAELGVGEGRRVVGVTGDGCVELNTVSLMVMVVTGRKRVGTWRRGLMSSYRWLMAYVVSRRGLTQGAGDWN